MVKKIGKKIIKNNLTKEELLKVIEVQKTSFADINQLSKTLKLAFGLPSIEYAKDELLNSFILFDESVKLVNKDTGDIYGMLLFGEEIIPVTREFLKSPMYDNICRLNLINGFAFIIDERLRGTGLDKKMLQFNQDFILENYDGVWCGVDEGLHSQNYWKRFGFTQMFENEDTTFFFMPFDKKRSS